MEFIHQANTFKYSGAKKGHVYGWGFLQISPLTLCLLGLAATLDLGPISSLYAFSTQVNHSPLFSKSQPKAPMPSC